MSNPKACRICEAKATGLHYGVTTCEGCKVFFKRYLGKHTQYKCYFGGNCIMNVQTRHRCKACRFQKCLHEGMSLEAIRLGRTPKLTTLFSSESTESTSPPRPSLPDTPSITASSVECTRHHTPTINEAERRSSPHSQAKGGSPAPHKSTARGSGNSGNFHHPLFVDQPSTPSEASQTSGNFFPGVEFPTADSGHSRTSSSDLSYIAPCSEVAVLPVSPPRSLPQEIQEDAALPVVIHESWAGFLQDLAAQYLENPVSPSAGTGMSENSPHPSSVVTRRPSAVHRYWGLLKAKNTVLEDSLNSVHQIGVDVFLEHYIRYENFVKETYELGNVPYQPQTSLEQMLVYIQEMVSYFGDKVARFALGLAGFAEMNVGDQSYLIKDRWLISFWIMNSKCYRDKEIYHPIGPHDLHYCRYWMDITATNVSDKFLEFLFHFTSEINSLQLTLTERFALLAVGLLKTDQSDLLANRPYIDFLLAHYLETLLRSLESASAHRPNVAEKLRQLVSQFSGINEINRKIIMTADLSHAPLRGPVDREDVQRLLTIPKSCG
ncbi:hypothetical protein RvY_14822 [Ramazzottius varieornatus]|uniref:Nuclear receptor domain-containing protein n=1 Tax=Ramazzottius varieornatus TaxID=947166 RepID=A0A1D1VSN5_RAMVA|nr:hypothetical protein RvY_14822 [Ramazzottius varieornatus]